MRASGSTLSPYCCDSVLMRCDAFQAEYEAEVGSMPRTMFSVTGKFMHQLEVLVHHADAEIVGDVRVVDAHVPPRMRMLPVRLVQAEEDAHQRRLAGAVFAEQRMDLFPEASVMSSLATMPETLFRMSEHLDDEFVSSIPFSVLPELAMVARRRRRSVRRLVGGARLPRAHASRWRCRSPCW